MPGPVPQEARRRRNKPAIEPTRVDVAAPVVAGPALPDAERYSERTRAWYETWRTSEQSGLFTSTAWLTLSMLADLVDAYFEAPSAEKWSQVKQTQAGLLALPADQRRANFKVEQPQAAAAAAARRSDPRARLRAVEDAS